MLYITSTITVVGVAVSLFMPLLPEDVFACASSMSLARTTLRGCYTVLIVATAIANLVFVLLWRPIDRCNWDMDVSWSASLRSTSSYCHNASLAAWTIAASLRVIVTLITAVSLSFDGTCLIDKQSFSCCTSSSSDYISSQGILQNAHNRFTTLRS